MQNFHITFFVDFTVSDSILYMSGNDGLVFVKQFCRLALRKPDGIILQFYIQFDSTLQ